MTGSSTTAGKRGVAEVILLEKCWYDKTKESVMLNEEGIEASQWSNRPNAEEAKSNGSLIWTARDQEA